MKKFLTFAAAVAVLSVAVWGQSSGSAKKPAAAPKAPAPVPEASATFKPGTVTGSFTVNGKKAVFKYAYAFLQNGSFHHDRDNVYVILSDAPITEAMLAEEWGLSKAAGDGKLHAILVEFDEKMQPGMGNLYHDGYKEFSAFAAQGPHEFVPSASDSKTIAGKLSAKPQTTEEKDRWEYTATFSAPINPKLKEMATQ